MAEELTEDQLRDLADTLRRLETQLHATLTSSAEGAKPVDLDEPIGRLSRMDAMQQQEMVQAGRRFAEARLRAVHRALAAVEDGTYGVCTLCDEPIAFRRLEARPEVAVCIRCQSERERGG